MTFHANQLVVDIGASLKRPVLERSSLEGQAHGEERSGDLVKEVADAINASLVREEGGDQGEDHDQLVLVNASLQGHLARLVEHHRAADGDRDGVFELLQVSNNLEAKMAKGGVVEAGQESVVTVTGKCDASTSPQLFAVGGHVNAILGFVSGIRVPGVEHNIGDGALQEGEQKKGTP